MELARLLEIEHGITSIIGSGGKTTLLRTLAGVLPGTVALATSTRIFPFEGMPLLDGSSWDDALEALADNRIVCVGAPAEHGKLAMPRCGFEELGRLADYVLVEADGSRGLPLKAHEPWEPVVPECSAQTILVVGARGLGKPIHDAVHRAKRFCELTECGADDPATPERVARAINVEHLATRVLISQITPDTRTAAQELASLLDVPALIWE